MKVLDLLKQVQENSKSSKKVPGEISNPTYDNLNTPDNHVGKKKSREVDGTKGLGTVEYKKPKSDVKAPKKKERRSMEGPSTSRKKMKEGMKFDKTSVADEMGVPTSKKLTPSRKAKIQKQQPDQEMLNADPGKPDLNKDVMQARKIAVKKVHEGISELEEFFGRKLNLAERFAMEDDDYSYDDPDHLHQEPMHDVYSYAPDRMGGVRITHGDRDVAYLQPGDDANSFLADIEQAEENSVPDDKMQWLISQYDVMDESYPDDFRGTPYDREIKGDYAGAKDAVRNAIVEYSDLVNEIRNSKTDPMDRKNGMIDLVSNLSGMARQAGGEDLSEDEIKYIIRDILGEYGIHDVLEEGWNDNVMPRSENMAKHSALFPEDAGDQNSIEKQILNHFMTKDTKWQDPAGTTYEVRGSTILINGRMYGRPKDSYQGAARWVANYAASRMKQPTNERYAEFSDLIGSGGQTTTKEVINYTKNVFDSIVEFINQNQPKNAFSCIFQGVEALHVYKDKLNDQTLNRAFAVLRQAQILSSNNNIDWNQIKSLISGNINLFNDPQVSESNANNIRVSLSKRKNDYGEYVVKWVENGRVNDAKSYHTDDWDDAVGTKKDMMKRAGIDEGFGDTIKGAVKTAMHGAPGSKERDERQIQHGKDMMKQGADRKSAHRMAKKKFTDSEGDEVKKITIERQSSGNYRVSRSDGRQFLIVRVKAGYKINGFGFPPYTVLSLKAAKHDIVHGLTDDKIDQIKI